MANQIEDVDAVKATINEAIETISEKYGFGPREQYKALRGLAFQAFGQLIEAGEFKQLIRDAQTNAKHLPRGWGMVSQAEREVASDDTEAAEKPAKKTSTRKTTKKAAAPVEAPAEAEDEVVAEKPARRRRAPRKSAE